MPFFSIFSKETYFRESPEQGPENFQNENFEVVYKGDWRRWPIILLFVFFRQEFKIMPES